MLTVHTLGNNKCNSDIVPQEETLYSQVYLNSRYIFTGNQLTQVAIKVAVTTTINAYSTVIP